MVYNLIYTCVYLKIDVSFILRINFIYRIFLLELRYNIEIHTCEFVNIIYI